MIRAPKNYKRRTLVLLIVTVAALVVCAASLALKRDALAVQGNPEQTYESYYSPNGASSQENGYEETFSRSEPAISRPSPTPTPSPAPAGSYLVTVYNGKIGVFQKGELSPFLTADVNVYLLPEADQKLLRKGIPAESLSQVKGIVEDYE